MTDAGLVIVVDDVSYVVSNRAVIDGLKDWLPSYDRPRRKSIEACVKTWEELQDRSTSTEEDMADFLAWYESDCVTDYMNRLLEEFIPDPKIRKQAAWKMIHFREGEWR
jgi:hypothetical protein